MKRERRGDWPDEMDILEEGDPGFDQTHDVPDPPKPTDAELQKADEARERREGHPSDHHRLDDPELD